MPIQNVGDMSQHFQSLRQVGQVKTTLNRLSNELATQQKSDITASLGGATEQLETLEREISRLTSFESTAQQIGQRLSIMQSTLSGVEDARRAAMSQFLGTTTESSASAIQNAALAGQETFSRISEAFNTRMADRALFGGVATDRAPLASADTMLTDIKASIAGLTSSDDIVAAVNTWFDDPIGGFATLGYLGDSGPHPTQAVGPNSTLTIRARADDSAATDLLKAAALAALADDSVPGLTKSTRATLVNTSGQLLLGAADGLTNLRGSLGANEAAVSETSVTISTQLTAFQINRNELTVADPFETATKLQDVQQQLEMQYTVTARLSQLSLVNYLR